MSNISSQLIKDSYNYVLQSDLISGIVYRIGGSVAENPKFISGLTVNANFTYSDGSEFPGFVLTCDASGNAVWGPVSGATSGVVVTGGTFDYSAGTLTLVLSNGVNVPISGLEDIYVTGGVVSGNSIVFSYNDTNTFEVSGITSFDTFTSYTASTEQILNSKVDNNTFNSEVESIEIEINNRVQIPTFTAYTASTQVQINNKLDTSGFTAYTATTQPLILNAVTGGTYSGGTLYLINNSGATIPISGFTTGGTSTTDSYVTGFSLNNETITLSQNRIDQYSAFNISLSGYITNNIFSSYTASTQSTINNKLDTSGFTAYTATTQPLILNSVTGGTFSGGTLYLINNSGSTIPISGFTTGGTSTTDTFVTGFTLSANTITLSQNRIDSYSSFTISLSAYTGSSVSGEYLPLSGGTVTGGTTFQSGLTANTISATTYYNLPKDVFVTGGTYTNGDVIFTNNTGGTFTVSGFAVGGGGGQIFYLNISQSKNGNRYLSTTASTAAEQSTGATIANGATGTIASFQSDVLNATLIPGGIWAFHLHSYKSNTNASFNIFVEVYKRTSGGTETLLFTSDPTPVTTNSPNTSMQISDAYFSGSPILVSDSIVARVRATNTSNQSHVITLFSEGTQHYSYAVSSIPTQQGLTCDTLSGCSIIQTIQTDVSNKFDKSGGTINGNVLVQNGLTANTISATTISGDTLYGDGSNLTNVPNIYNIDGFLTGQRTINLNNNDLFIKDDLWGLNYNFYTKLKFSIFNDSDPTTEFSVNPATGEVSVGGPFQTANSIVVLNNLSADNTTPYLLGLDVTNNVRTFDANYIYNSITGGSFSADTLYLTNNTGGTVPISGFTSGSGSFTGGTVSGATNFTGGLTANTISATTYQNLPFSGTVNGGGTSNYLPKWTGSTGLGNSQIRDDGTYIGIGNTPLSSSFITIFDSTVTTATTASLKVSTNSNTKKTISVEGGGVGVSSYVFALPTAKAFEARVANGTNAYGIYATISPDNESAFITNGIGGYFEVGNIYEYGEPTNKYSLQLKDGTQGVNKVLTSVTSDGKANWSGTLNVSAVTATTITSNSVKVLPVALTVISNTASTDASLSSIFTLTLTGNTTLATPTNGFSGQRIVYRLRQDGTGNKLLTLSSGFRSGPITVTLSTAANTTDYLGVIYNEIDNEWDVLALNKGYS